MIQSFIGFLQALFFLGGGGWVRAEVFVVLFLLYRSCFNKELKRINLNCGLIPGSCCLERMLILE